MPTQEDCLVAESVAKNAWFQSVEFVQIALSSANLILFAVCALHRVRRRIKFHRNLRIVLFGFLLAILPRDVMNIALFTSNLVRFYAHQDPCQLLTVGWVVTLLRAPRVTHSILSTCALVGVVVERTHAIRHARSYEKSGSALGILLLTFNLMCAVGMLVFLYWNYDFLELYKAPNARAGTLDSRGTSYYALNLAILIIVLAVLYVVNRVNAKRRQAARNVTGAYDLSESYQLHENEVFLQIFIPFAFACASCLAVYHAMMLSMRMFSIPDLVVKVSASETIYMFSLLSTSFGILAYMRMLRKLAAKTDVIAVQPSEQGNVYFDHFRRLMETDMQSRPQSRASRTETAAVQSGLDDLAGRNRSAHAWWGNLASLITTVRCHKNPTSA